MTHSNKYKCGSVRNDEIIKLHLGSSAGPIVRFSCLLATFIDSIRPKNQAGKNKEPRNDIQYSTNCIALS